MTSTIDYITSCTSEFISQSRNICRIYREFDVISKKDATVWLALCVKEQHRTQSAELQQVVEELQAALNSKF